MIQFNQGDVHTRYYGPDELMDIHEGLFANSAIRAFDLTTGLVICTDSMTGTSHRMSVTRDQAAALIWLLIQEDEGDAYIANTFYMMLDSVLEGCPPECRPIP